MILPAFPSVSSRVNFPSESWPWHKRNFFFFLKNETDGILDINETEPPLKDSSKNYLKNGKKGDCFFKSGLWVHRGWHCQYFPFFLPHTHPPLAASTKEPRCLKFPYNTASKTKTGFFAFAEKIVIDEKMWFPSGFPP